MRTATEQTYQERLLKVQRHIQEHLDDELTLVGLARVAHFSPFHFHRIFRGMTGESLAGFIRRLRLERAAMFLRSSRRPVTRIAFEAGYDSHEAFTRAFRSRFGMAPSAYRRQRIAEDLVGHEDTVVLAERRHSLSRYIITQAGGTTMKITVKELPEMRVASVRHTGPYAQCKGAWDALCMWAGPRGLIGPRTRFFGISHDDPEVTPPDKIRYDACLTIEGDIKPERGITLQTIGGGRYVTVTHKGPYEKLSDTYAVICGQWAPQSGHELRAAPCLEEYLNSPDETAPEDLLTDVYVPIE
jgi:AraC family transcriptional regulator